MKLVMRGNKQLRVPDERLSDMLKAGYSEVDPQTGEPLLVVKDTKTELSALRKENKELTKSHKELIAAHTELDKQAAALLEENKALAEQVEALTAQVAELSKPAE